MRTMQLFVFLFWRIVIAKATYHPPQKEAKFLDPKDHKKVKISHQYLHLKGLSEVLCVGHCTLTDDCHSVNYHSEDQICLVIDEIIKGDGDFHLIDAHGWRYFEKSKVQISRS